MIVFNQGGMKTKICIKCKTEKSYDEFYDHHDLRRPEGKRKYTYVNLIPSDGKMGRCKECVKTDVNKSYHASGKETQRRRLLWQKYGITLEEYTQRLDEQGGVCAICGGTVTAKGGVDHCHASGKIRGILCHHCNVAIGNLKDDISLLKKAIIYLERNGANNGI